MPELVCTAELTASMSFCGWDTGALVAVVSPPSPDPAAGSTAGAGVSAVPVNDVLVCTIEP